MGVEGEGRAREGKRAKESGRTHERENMYVYASSCICVRAFVPACARVQSRATTDCPLPVHVEHHGVLYVKADEMDTILTASLAQAAAAAAASRSGSGGSGSGDGAPNGAGDAINSSAKPAPEVVVVSDDSDDAGNGGGDGDARGGAAQPKRVEEVEVD